MNKRWRALIVLIACFALAPCARGESSGADIRAVAAEGSHALALDTKGRVWAWGSNQRGETAPEDESARVLTPAHVFSGAKAIAAGQQFSMALTSEGELYMWGDNRQKQIPGASDARVSEATRVMENVFQIDACDERAVAVTTDGKLYAWGGGEGVSLLMENVKMAAVGLDFALALTNDGDVYFTGSSDYLESGADADAPVKLLSGMAGVYASGQSLFAVDESGRAYAWGANGSEGRLGVSSASGWLTTPTALALEGVSRVIPGLSCSAALTSDGALSIWGAMYSHASAFDEEGALAASLVDGELIHYGGAPVRIYEGVLDAAFGDAFVALLFADGNVYTWGSNDQGQIGDGAYTEVSLTQGEEEGEYELDIVSSSQRVFPALAIQLRPE